MSNETEAIDWTRPYGEHGVELRANGGGGQLVGDCPFCAGSKFYVKELTGQWDCKRCVQQGNFYGFLQLLWEESAKHTDPTALAALCKERKLLRVDTLTAWGVVQSQTTGEWLVPAHNPEGKLSNLYRYVQDAKTRKYRLWSTVTCKQHLFGMPLRKDNAKRSLICEGPWDAMALWEVLSQAKRSGVDRFAYTTDQDLVVTEDTNILAVAGCGMWNLAWNALFQGQEVTLLYDSDHPRRVCKACNVSFSLVNSASCPKCKGPGEVRLIRPAGYEGMKKAAAKLYATSDRPGSIHYVNWGEGGYNRNVPSGYDVRDILVAHLEVQPRIEAFNSVAALCTAVPTEWLPHTKASRSIIRASTSDLIDCSEWAELVNEWRMGMKWTEGLDRGLSIMLAAGSSVLVPGDQLWVIGTSPPSTGKTTIAMALAMCEEYAINVDILRGFHSGYQSDREGTEDNSLIQKIRDKVMITKDGDTLLQSPNLPQILAEGRGLYDRSSAAEYKNKRSESYKGVNMVWLLFGTSSLRELDDSELGQRFLSSVFMDEIPLDLEQAINLKNLAQMRSTYSEGHGLNGSGSDTKHIHNAQRMTAGYLKHLYENINKKLTKVEFPDEAMFSIERYARLVAHLRARPSEKQDEEVAREMSTRVCNQLGKLAYCLAVTLNRTSVDTEVLRRVRKTALDTARGKVLKLVQKLALAGEQGGTVAGLSHWMHESEDKCRKLLHFLGKIHVVHAYIPSIRGIKQPVRYRLTDMMKELYSDVLHEQDQGAT